jgi:hypothetical protein
MSEQYRKNISVIDDDGTEIQMPHDIAEAHMCIHLLHAKQRMQPLSIGEQVLYSMARDMIDDPE